VRPGEGTWDDVGNVNGKMEMKREPWTETSGEGVEVV